MGLEGLCATYIEVLRTKKSAQQAAVAAQAAAYAIEARFSLADAAYASSQLNQVKDFVSKGDLRVAEVVFALVKRMVGEICCAAPADDGIAGQIAQAQTSMKTVDHQLDLGIGANTRHREQTLLTALRGVSDFLGWGESRLKHDRRST